MNGESHVTYFAYDTPIGPLTVTCDGEVVVRIDFGDVDQDGVRKPTVLSNQTANQILQYLSGKSHVFNVPVRIEGTDFQRLVLHAILDIPYGHTRSYSDVARMIGHPKASRAVGTALANNPIPLIFPCHRVVLSSGAIGSYRGGTEVKKRLLDLERRNS